MLILPHELNTYPVAPSFQGSSSFQSQAARRDVLGSTSFSEYKFLRVYLPCRSMLDTSSTININYDNSALPNCRL